MLKVVAVLLVMSTAAAAAFLGWLTADIEPSVRHLEELQGDPQHGAYLARLAGCVTCHTDLANGGSFLAGGPAIITAYGTFFAPNITSDVSYGIGAWTLRQFADALVNGRSPDGDYYYPAFPHRRYAAFTDQDIVDLWAALKTVTPAQAESPDHRLSFPVSSRRLIVPWRKVTALIGRISGASQPASDSGRGAYIATGPGLCVECHGKRSLFGAVTAAGFFPGAGEGVAGAPPLHAANLKRRGWTSSGLAEALRTGRYPSGEPFTSPMSEVVRGSTTHLTAVDRSALANYLLGIEDGTTAAVE